jgi:NADPH:quinone reductase-like Zn-dependent oxidoreductase
MASVLPSSFSALVSTTAAAPLKIVTQPMPKLLSNNILIKVHAAAINPVDVQLWKSPILSRLGGVEKGFGRDYSGVIVKIGDAVTGWKVGDECFGLLFAIVCLGGNKLKSGLLNFEMDVD